MKIKECRKRAGITQAQLAQKLGIAQNTVAMWETGRQCPRALDIPAIADALNCSVDALYGREGGEGE